MASTSLTALPLAPPPWCGGPSGAKASRRGPARLHRSLPAGFWVLSGVLALAGAVGGLATLG